MSPLQRAAGSWERHLKKVTIESGRVHSHWVVILQLSMHQDLLEDLLKLRLLVPTLAFLIQEV